MAEKKIAEQVGERCQSAHVGNVPRTLLELEFVQVCELLAQQADYRHECLHRRQTRQPIECTGQRATEPSLIKRT